MPDTRSRAADRMGWAFLGPALAVLGVFALGPMGYAVYLSVQGAPGSGGGFAGLTHYREALGSEVFWGSVEHTVYYALGVVPGSMALGLLFALGLYRVRWVQGILRTVFFLPYVTALVAAAMVWRAMLEPQQGPANAALGWLGIPAQGWLLEPRGVLHLLTGGAVDAAAGPSLALCSVIAFDVWRMTGFTTVLFLAGLAAVSRELEEAARLDGARGWRVSWHVRIPALRPIAVFVAVVGAIQSFQAFSSFYALTGTGRGPLNSTQNVTVHIFSSFYEFQRMEYGAAVAVLLSGAVMLFTWAQWRMLSRRAMGGA
jgi:multiple sugar transport system permease protein